MGDIVERLDAYGQTHGGVPRPLMQDALAEIRRLEEERDELQFRLNHGSMHFFDEAMRYREALERMVEMSKEDPNLRSTTDYVLIATEALGEEE